mmetsp:Transcript_1311/g.2509  ORF Transcript_1311/g.2509 Transcript_1311/m.2509 type:complete len:259 (+) Transcript_1311:347-1123(+)
MYMQIIKYTSELCIGKLFDPTDNVLTIGDLAKSGNMLANASNNELSLCRANEIDHLLNHIICVLVLDHQYKWGCCRRVHLVPENLLHKNFQLLRASVRKTLLHYIASKFVLAQCDNSPIERFHDLFPVRNGSMDENVLDDVVPVLVLTKLVCVVQDLCQDRIPLFFRAVLEQPLNYSTTVRVSGEVINLIDESFDNKLDKQRRHLFDTFLDHMVSILVFNAMHHMTNQFTHQGGLSLHVGDIDSFLHHAASIHLQRQS